MVPDFVGVADYVLVNVVVRLVPLGLDARFHSMPELSHVL